jgi:hypothetical protein
MKDTSDALERKYRDMLLERSGGGTREDGMFHARHGSSVGPCLDIASRSSSVSRRVKESALSSLLWTGFRCRDAQKDSPGVGEEMTSDVAPLLYKDRP